MFDLLNDSPDNGFIARLLLEQAGFRVRGRIDLFTISGDTILIGVNGCILSA